ncbi:alginate export family protein [Sediminitomix flava]|uniref:Alginate export protein n=1 Tax=Sediminitomix flava TaxID=379075 RepID=A0A315Z600_SEDFL|nr:alginate export family protein [Sediminitomix flava]PWJ38639.1 alginate export protein [Sediminitomix flava]
MIETILLLLILLFRSSVYAQEYKVDLDIRSRFEYRKGFGEPRPTDEDLDVAANFISQRTRMNTFFKDKRSFIELKFSFQDVRTWGATPILNNIDYGNFSLYEGWAKFNISKSTSIKVGRQELKYDDYRILGNVDWAQQGLVHEAIVFTYEGLFKIHVGGGYQTDEENLYRQAYSSNNYKTLQFVWLNKSFKKLQLSFLFLNNGIEQVESIDPNFTASDLKIRFSQTMGGRLLFNLEFLDVTLNGYYQTGKDGVNRNINAYNLLLELRGKLYELVEIIVGGELLSGNDVIDDGSNKAFNPLYGMNHKFNGLMDYYYVGGRHVDNVGLQDYYAKLKFNIRDNWKLNANYHLFKSIGRQLLNSSGDLTDISLGQEFDFIATYELNNQIKFDGGFSFLFAQEGIIDLRQLSTGIARDKNKINKWGWFRVSINPTIFFIKNEN